MDDRRLWMVTLQADDRTYRHIVVSASCEDDAIDSACNVELAPRRSVVGIKPYEGE